MPGGTLVKSFSRNGLLKQRWWWILSHNWCLQLEADMNQRVVPNSPWVGARRDRMGQTTGFCFAQGKFSGKSSLRDMSIGELAQVWKSLLNFILVFECGSLEGLSGFSPNRKLLPIETWFFFWLLDMDQTFAGFGSKCTPGKDMTIMWQRDDLVCEVSLLPNHWTGSHTMHTAKYHKTPRINCKVCVVLSG